MPDKRFDPAEAARILRAMTDDELLALMRRLVQANPEFGPKLLKIFERDDEEKKP